MDQVIITRAREDAERTAGVLRAAGFAPLITPLIQPAPKAFALPEGDFDAVILTSAQAAQAVAGSAAARLLNLPVFTVGARTSELAKSAGARDIRAGSGNAAALAGIIAEALPQGSRLLYLAGLPRKPDLELLLPNSGFRLAVCEVYETRRAEKLPDALAAALKSGAARHSLHYSRESAVLFLRLADSTGLGGQARALTHICLSAGTAQGLDGVPADNIRIARQPDEASLIEALRRDKPGADTAGAPPVLGGSGMTGPDPAPDSSRGAPAKPARRFTHPAMLFAAGAALIAALAWKVSRDIEQTDRRIASAEAGAQAAARQAAELKQTAESLAARLQTAEAAQRARPEAVQAAEQKLSAIEQRLAGLDRAFSELKAADASGKAAGIETSLKALQAETSALSRRLDAAALAGAAEAKGDAAAALAPLLQRLEAAEARARHAPAEGSSAVPARLPVVAAAKAAFDSGKPLGPLIKALQALGVDAAALTQFAESGAPGAPALARELSELSRNLSVSAAPDKNAGILERFSASARSLVTTPGAGADEAVKAAEAALARGDFSGAAAALGKLPAGARQAAEPLLGRLAARRAAAEALERFEQQALQALASPGN